MYKFNSVQKVIEHLGPSSSGATCTAANAVLSATSTCIPNASNFTSTSISAFAANARCVNGTVPQLTTDRKGNKYMC
jgi:hypothetical protein